MKSTISLKLLKALQRGTDKLSVEALQKVSAFVESQKTPKHSFIGRGGDPDIYYSLFGWMLYYVLGIKCDKENLALCLSQYDETDLDLVHYAAYMRCRMLYHLLGNKKSTLLLRSVFNRKIKNLDEFEVVPHDDPQSPYTGFIWLSLLEDTGNTVKSKEFDLTVLEDYHLADGGYMNVKNGRTATTNATVAALSIIGQLKGYNKNEDVLYLRDLQNSLGGFRAVADSPVPDLLSTATALFMLHCYGVEPKYSAEDFVEAHWLDSGGFSATLLDELSDVEYTFYGLLALGAI